MVLAFASDGCNPSRIVLYVKHGLLVQQSSKAQMSTGVSWKRPNSALHSTKINRGHIQWGQCFILKDEWSKSEPLNHIWMVRVIRFLAVTWSLKKVTWHYILILTVYVWFKCPYLVRAMFYYERWEKQIWVINT